MKCRASACILVSVEKPTVLDKAVESRNGRVYRILVAECDPAVSFALDLILRREGFQVSRVGTGATAFDLARIEPFDLALLDVDLPDIDGFKLCVRFQADPVAKAIPVVIWSARGDLSSKAIEVGALGCLDKTSDFKVIGDRLRQYMASPRRAGTETAES